MLITHGLAEINASTFIEFLSTEQTVTSADDIEFTVNAWNPDKNWVEIGKTKAWIDIVGYNGLIQYNDTMYINTNHTNAAYILYGTGHTVSGKYSFDSLTARITNRSYDGNAVTAALSTKLKYHWTRTDCHLNLEGKKKCKEITTRYKKENIFTEIDECPPERYPSYIPIENVSVIVYNNSIKPKTTIRLHPVNYTLGYHIQYNNESVEYYHNVLQIEYKANQFPFGNVTPTEINSIYEDSDVFSRVGSTILINSTEINDNLKIYAITPYDEVEINFTVSNYSSGPGLTKMEMSSLFSILMMGWFIVFLIKRMRV